MNNKLLLGIAIGLATSVAAGMTIEYIKHGINRRRALRGIEPLGSFEEGEWQFDPTTNTATWVSTGGVFGPRAWDMGNVQRRIVFPSRGAW